MTIEQTETLIRDAHTGLEARHAAEVAAFVAWTREARRVAYVAAVNSNTSEGPNQ